MPRPQTASTADPLALVEEPAAKWEPLWPTTFAGLDPELGGLSPLPAIWLVGRSGRGKSSFGAALSEYLWVADTEQSWSTLKLQRPKSNILNIRELGQRFGKEQPQYNWFLAFREELDKVRPGQYQVGIVDTFSDLHFGSYFYVPDNARIFGKSANNYNGKEGNMFQWADATVLWEELIVRMAELFETTILMSHPKDEFDKTTKSRTGRQLARGADIQNKVSLKLWLFDKRDPAPTKDGPRERWALVEKSRLTYLHRREGSRFPVLQPLLPAILRPEFEGETFGEVIWRYMNQPLDYGDDVMRVEGDPTNEMSEAEKANIERQRFEEAQAAELRSAKIEMFNRLKKDGLIADQNALAELLIRLELTEDVQYVAKILAVEAEIRKYLAAESDGQ